LDGNPNPRHPAGPPSPRATKAAWTISAETIARSISACTNAALVAAKARGVKLGRPDHDTDKYYAISRIVTGTS
jgi:hypothetical protein